MTPLSRAMPAIVLLLAGPAIADPALDARVARLERILSTQGPSELLIQVQRLQQEVQELRGLVETHQFLLERLQGQGGSGTTMRGDPWTYEDSYERDPWGTVPITDQGADPGTDRSGATWPSSERRDPAGSWADERPSAPGMLALPSPETASPSEQEAYQQAVERLRERDYDGAITAFRDLLERHPAGRYSTDAHFWLGETLYVTRDYAAAMAHYDRVIADDPQSPRVPAAMLKVGYIHHEGRRLDAARAVLEEIPQRFPDSTEARLAQDRLRRIAREPN
ncbi:tol-pal system protein YbgF [Thioalkalicoccus limnaeus]|uniref:Cell division coordinator CpoB n=1 Tax=Thioalkalicoccus limnaeus TaxID=120681 RepID=A0ABV4B9R0_9GAMM